MFWYVYLTYQTLKLLLKYSVLVYWFNVRYTQLFQSNNSVEYYALIHCIKHFIAKLFEIKIYNFCNFSKLIPLNIIVNTYCTCITTFYLKNVQTVCIIYLKNCVKPTDKNYVNILINEKLNNIRL